LSQITRIGQLCGFLEHPQIAEAIHQAAPVTVPQSIGALGFDPPLWIGLGIVGLWAALDAHAERSNLPKARCPTCNRPGCLWGRLSATGKLSVPPLSLALEEIEDMRHLFAHNYAGDADAAYFAHKRHVLSQSPSAPLSCGAVFDGNSLSLNATHLRHYVECAKGIAQAHSQ